MDGMEPYAVCRRIDALEILCRDDDIGKSEFLRLRYALGNATDRPHLTTQTYLAT